MTAAKETRAILLQKDLQSRAQCHFGTAKKEPKWLWAQDWKTQYDNKLNRNKYDIDRVKGQVDRILTQWRIREPQKTHINFFQAQTLQ